MSVAVRPWRKPGKFQIDIIFKKPNGERVRDQRVIEAKSEGMARRWGEAREAQLRAGALVIGTEKCAAPTWDDFFPRFLADREGTRRKASSMRNFRSIDRVHLSPAFGRLPLDQITDERMSMFRAALARGDGKPRSPKTVNCVLTVLLSSLKLAVEWRVIEHLPCRIRIRPVHSERPDFYDADDYVRLCSAASQVGTRESVLVRLGGDAGLRRGEMIALRWTDCDFRRRHVRVEQAAWKESAKTAKTEGIAEWRVDKPKGGKGRIVPMTTALYDVLQAHRHLRGERVLCLEDGSEVHGTHLRDWLEAAQRRAGMPVLGALHKLRHTFCSHLSMRGAPVKAIQELAGHANLTTTMRYMHLSPGALDAAIRLLEPGAVSPPANANAR